MRYRGALANYLIDTGDEVILVDTGLPAGTPEEAPDEKSPAFTGRDVGTYMSQFAALGYKPEQVTKILLTHKHADHSGELKSFPNAKIYVNADEVSADELKGLGNLVPVTFTEGPYYNFPASQKIRDGIYYIKAKELPHNTAAHLAVPFPTSAACRFLDLPPVNLRNLQLHLSKNSLAS